MLAFLHLHANCPMLQITTIIVIIIIVIIDILVNVITINVIIVIIVNVIIIIVIMISPSRFYTATVKHILQDWPVQPFQASFRSISEIKTLQNVNWYPHFSCSYRHCHHIYRHHQHASPLSSSSSSKKIFWVLMCPCVMSVATDVLTLLWGVPIHCQFIFTVIVIIANSWSIHCHLHHSPVLIYFHRQASVSLPRWFMIWIFSINYSKYLI